MNLSKNKLDPVNIPPGITAYTNWTHHDKDHHDREGEESSGAVMMIKRMLKRFAENTSLHGLRYLSEPNRPHHERVFWLLTLAIVYCAAVKTVVEQIHNYEASPVLVSLDAEPTYIHYIPFPALSICPVDHTIVHPDTDDNTSTLYEEEMDLSKFICHTSKGNSLFAGQGMKYNIGDEAATRVLNRIFSYEQCTKLIQGIIWMNEVDRDPCKHFQPTAFKMGYCFTFNMLPLNTVYRNTTYSLRSLVNFSDYDEDEFWSLDGGYPENYPTKRPPWRIGGNGFENGVGVLIKSPPPDSTCMGDFAEVAVAIHGPHELPGPNHIMVPVHFNSFTMAQVKPRIVNTSEALLGWSPRHRGCFFESERRLAFFTKYNQKNCDLECEVNRTLKHCDCSPIYHPRTNGTPVCGSDRLECIKASMVREAILLSKSMFCDCKPSCNEIEFDVHSSSYRRNWSRFFGPMDKYDRDDIETMKFALPQLFKNNENGIYGGLHVSYLTKFPIAVRRNSILSGIHFIGNIGGLLGLFLGFSMISLAEILYFFLVRPFYKSCRGRKDKETNTDPPST